MTKNSIFNDVIRGIKRERPPVWFMRQAGRVLPSYNKMKEKHAFHEMMRSPELAATVTLLPVEDLGVDAAILFSDILVIPEALGMKLNFTEKGPEFDKPLFLASDVMKQLKPEPEALEHVYQAIAVIIDKKPLDVALIGFCGGPFTTFCYMLEGNSRNHQFPNALKFFYQYPKESEQILEAITELSVLYARSQSKHGVDAFQLFETHAGLIPSDVYIQRILPFVRKINDAVREEKVPVIFFPKGIASGFRYMTKDVADYISVDWQYPLADARELIDANVGIQGNFDQRLFSIDNQEIIINSLEQYKRFGKREHRWIFNAGHGLLPDNRVENVKLAVDWIKTTNWNR